MQEVKEALSKCWKSKSIPKCVLEIVKSGDIFKPILSCFKEAIQNKI